MVAAMHRVAMPNVVRPAAVAARVAAPRASIAKIGSVVKPILVGQPVVSQLNPNPRSSS